MTENGLYWLSGRDDAEERNIVFSVAGWLLNELDLLRKVSV